MTLKLARYAKFLDTTPKALATKGKINRTSSKLKTTVRQRALRMWKERTNWLV